MASARTEEQARKDLASLYYSAIKARSNLLESLGGDELMDKVLADLHPWLFGDKNVVPRLEVYTDPGRPVTPMEYYNWMVVCLRLAPIIAIASNFYGSGRVPVSMDEVQLYPSWPEES